ncbi:hypothetical protein Tco_0162396 [Tanacetum coccineum]
MPNDSPLLRGDTLGSNEGRMQQNELMDLVTKLSDKCAALERHLRQTKKVYGDAFTRLIKKVKKLEKTIKTSQTRRMSRVVISDDAEEDLEDSSKQGRMIEEINQELLCATKVLADAAKNVYTYTKRRRAFSTGSGRVSTASRLFSTDEELVSTIGASMLVSTAGTVQEVNKDKAVVRLQEQLDEEERQRIARVHEKTSSFNIEEWEDIQATIEADEELAQRIQVEEREKYSEAEKARLLAELNNQRKRYFAQQRAEERRNKPLTQA